MYNIHIYIYRFAPRSESLIDCDSDGSDSDGSDSDGGWERAREGGRRLAAGPGPEHRGPLVA